MLNRLQFNNLVISNKKGIQHSRVQTINKLVHKIRKLKTQLEKRPEDDKCKERIRKSTESMEHLKKFKRVEMMKNVLLLEKLPAAVITNGLSTPDEVAIALLAMNKVMQGLIKRFKTELHLTDAADGKWREELKENSKRRQKIERTEQKKRKRTALKEQKAMEHKRKEWLEQNFKNVGNAEKLFDTETEISTVGGWKVDEITVSNKSEKNEVPKSNPETQSLEKVREKKGKNKDTIVSSINKDSKKSSQIKRAQEENRTEDVNDLMPKKKPKMDERKLQTNSTFDDNKSSREEISLQQSEIAFESDDDHSPTETHVVDPFFVTDSGENYLSTAIINRNNNQKSNNDENTQKGLHMVKLSGSNKHANFRQGKHDQSDSSPYQKQNSGSNSNERATWKQNNDKWQQNSNKDKNPWRKGNDNNDRKSYRNNWTNSTEREPRKQIKDRFSNNSKVKINQSSSTTKTDEKLHPSWAAKQKQRPIITGFQGKKITFGEYGVTNETSNYTSSQNNAKFDRKNTSAQPHFKTDSIHPSWAAKQKLKPTITAFQGKKITFDNED